MATTQLVLTNTWQKLSTSGTHIIVQASDTASMFIGAAAPAASAAGHTVRNNMLHDFDSITSLGGNVWVRGAGTFTYSA